ncbi:MAG: M1 family metallopeptidase [Flavobacteriaceae bacterium]|nr:M1 family metallopeptidase [Flavobacteriaceae bacterium]
MKKIKSILLGALLLGFSSLYAQTKEAKEPQKGHVNVNKFRQMKDVLASPNSQHTASGKPGANYTQQKVDYIMDIVIDDDKQILTGSEKITYHNNSTDDLEYLWIQLDQNVRAKDSKSSDIQGGGAKVAYRLGQYTDEFLDDSFDGGFKLTSVKNSDGSKLSYTINNTMMRINLDTPVKSGEVFEFSIDWWYNINDHVKTGARSGYEPFDDENKNINYVIAQFFPRLAVYDNVEGWQNMEFWGRSEFALEFGDYIVNLTVPADHIANATGVLTNVEKMLTKAQYKRFKKAQTSYDDTVVIVTQEEAEIAEKKRTNKTKTWVFDAKNVRDFAFATSRKYIWDAMAVKINDRTVMAYSLYPKEGNPLWSEHSTRAVAVTLDSYSRMSFDYPYHKAISVHAKGQGMEYPQICFNHGRPDADGTYSDRERNGMLGVIIHEVGHNFFPMIVNSDERQWTWMDEGLNSFLEIIAERDYETKYPGSFVRANGNRGLPKNVARYMGGNQDRISPIMSQGDNVYQFGSNAYSKPAAGLTILRETIMGKELFDYAFRTYSKRWMFKHPTPADFFRTMEDASAMDLDWFFRGWFYTTDYNSMSIEGVKELYLTGKPTEEIKTMAKERGFKLEDLPPMVYLSDEKDAGKKLSELEEFTDKNYNADQKDNFKDGKYIYEISYKQKGGLMLPIIVEYTYEDGTTMTKQYPAQIWSKNHEEVKKIVSSARKIISIKLDPKMETADVDTSDNSWPKEKDNNFAKFENKKLKK